MSKQIVGKYISLMDAYGIHDAVYMYIYHQHLPTSDSEQNCSPWMITWMLFSL